MKTSFRMPHDIFFQFCFFGLFLWYFKQTVIVISYFFLYFTVWLVNINNSGTAVFNILVTSKSYGNICFFDQHYQPGEITAKFSVLMNYGWCNLCYTFRFNYCCSRNSDKEKWYAYVVKEGCRLWHKKISNYRVL